MHHGHLEQQFRDELDWVTSRRWFGDKARPVIDVRVLVADTVEIGESQLLLTLVGFIHEWGDPSTYFVPVLDGQGSLATREASSHLGVLRWFADGFGQDRVISGEGTWRWRTIGSSLPETSDLEDDSIHVIKGEQSNTSVIFGDVAICKLFRRLQPGVNPDLEIGEHLMHVAAFSQAADLFGVIELELNGERIDIAAFQQFVPNIGDGWSWLLERLAQPEARDSLLEDVRLLGTRTGEMHLALSDHGDDPAFQPELIGEDEAQTIIRRVIGEMEGSVEGLTHHLQPDAIEQLHKSLGLMMADAWSLVDTMLIRVHGDYHLGQTLRTTDNDWVIIDFEGEPSRTMTERREKLPALKDVAGMVRSLDYAGATLMQQLESDQHRADVATWVKNATETFVSAYRTTIAQSEIPLVPQGDDAFNSVLNLMIAEKALYELRYEMNNRPDWLWIPLGALLRLVGMEEVR